jgi:hypothetical protein
MIEFIKRLFGFMPKQEPKAQYVMAKTVTEQDKFIERVQRFNKELVETIESAGVKVVYGQKHTTPRIADEEHRIDYTPTSLIHTFTLPNQSKYPKSYFELTFKQNHGYDVVIMMYKEGEDGEVHQYNMDFHSAFSIATKVLADIKWQVKPTVKCGDLSLEIKYKWWVVGQFSVDGVFTGWHTTLAKYKTLRHAQAAMKQHWNKGGKHYNSFPVKDVRIEKNPLAHLYLFEEEEEWEKKEEEHQILLCKQGMRCKKNRYGRDNIELTQRLDEEDRRKRLAHIEKYKDGTTD